MALTWYQKIQYRDRLSAFRPIVGSDSLGVAQAPAWSSILTAVPCYCELTANLNDPMEAAGRNKRMTIYVLDAVHVELSVGRLLRPDDRLYIVAMASDGPLTFWERLEGAPQFIRGPNNFANKAKIEQMEEEKPDPALLALAGV